MIKWVVVARTAPSIIRLTNNLFQKNEQSQKTGTPFHEIDMPLDYKLRERYYSGKTCPCDKVCQCMWCNGILT